MFWVTLFLRRMWKSLYHLVSIFHLIYITGIVFDITNGSCYVTYLYY